MVSEFQEIDKMSSEGINKAWNQLQKYLTMSKITRREEFRSEVIEVIVWSRIFFSLKYFLDNIFIYSVSIFSINIKCCFNYEIYIKY